MAGKATKTGRTPGSSKIKVYCPTGAAVIDKYLNFVPRIDTLDGKKVGLLWNGKPNGDFFLDRVAELLKERFSGVEVVKFWEVDPRGTAHPDKKSDEALDFIARSADIVIAGQGD